MWAVVSGATVLEDRQAESAADLPHGVQDT
jgi:hypothetical protein